MAAPSSGPPREQIVVRVGPDGTISAETLGMKGAKCLDYVTVLEDLLEASATSSAFTAEYLETAPYQQTETHTYDEARNDLQQR